MNPRKPLDELTWKKNSKYATIDKILHKIIIIDKDTGKTISSIKDPSEIPPITRKRKKDAKK